MGGETVQAGNSELWQKVTVPGWVSHISAVGGEIFVANAAAIIGLVSRRGVEMVKNVTCAQKTVSSCNVSVA